MKKEIKDKWVKALNSGDYKQTKETLSKNNGFCCLGVLCDLYHKETNKGEWHIHDKSDNQLGSRDFIDKNGNVGHGVPPKNVLSWAGLMDGNPSVKFKNETISIAELNDGGKRFKTIAKIIDEQL